jgi:uncharacterized YigZ family protein
MNSRSDTYRTVKATSTGNFRSKGSKFIASLHPLRSEESIPAILNEIRKEHPKANHICYAYRTGNDPLKEHQSDDREPSGSAGLPILRVLQSAGLVNCIATVVRYFGGTKLGIPGLIEAYREAAGDSITNAEIIEDVFTEQLKIECSYDLLNELYRLTGEHDGKITYDESGQDPVILCLQIPVSAMPGFIQKLENTYPLNKKLRIIKP